MKTTRNVVLTVLSAAIVGAAFAQDYGTPNSGFPDDDIRQTVARLAYISGDVSFARGDDPDEWQPADPNIPMTLGDRVWTGGGRLELQVHGGNIVRLANGTDLAALNLTEDTQQFSVSSGVASFQIRRLGDDDVFEVDTPNAAITFERTGDYRIDVRENGETRLQVRRGRAIVASGGGQVPLGAGDGILIEGQEPPRYDMVAVSAPDGWDRWVAEREAGYANVRSYQYVSADIAGVVDLDRHGNWHQVPNYGWCWAPASVSVGWQPYRAGRWIWQDPWGWTWVSTEPWGWAPYHYGRWVTWHSRWYWVPVAPRAAVVAYSPALVAFVGGGPGFSVSVGVGVGYVGWFPLAPRDPMIPWWGRPAVNVNVTHVTYVNRTYVTVVNQQTFVSSRVVTNNYVRDRSIIREVERAPVVRGTVPIMPTHESIRVVSRQAAVARPPASAVSRTVVTRSAPPPAPPRFDQKVAVIRENRGRPVTSAEATNLAPRDGRAAQPVRPAAAEAGRVTLAPKTENSRAPRPEPVVPDHGRTLATKEQPVAPDRTGSTARPTSQARPEDRDRAPTNGRPPAPPQSQERPESQERKAPSARPTARPQPSARPAKNEQPATRPTPRPQTQVRPEDRGQDATRDRSQTQARPEDHRPPQRPTARSLPPESHPQANPERSVERPASPPPAGANERHAAPKPTPRPTVAHVQSQSRVAAPHEGDPRIEPESRKANPAPSSAPPERGRKPTPTPKKSGH